MPTLSFCQFFFFFSTFTHLRATTTERVASQNEGSCSEGCVSCMVWCKRIPPHRACAPRPVRPKVIFPGSPEWPANHHTGRPNRLAMHLARRPSHITTLTRHPVHPFPASPTPLLSKPLSAHTPRVRPIGRSPGQWNGIPSFAAVPQRYSLRPLHQ